MILSRADYKNIAKMPILEKKAGVILSGPYLIDNPVMNKLFIQEFVHEAIGIKLECFYLIKAMRQATKNIIAKAVCVLEMEGRIKCISPLQRLWQLTVFSKNLMILIFLL